MMCPRCKEEDIGEGRLVLCELCVCAVQAWAEDRGSEIKKKHEGFIFVVFRPLRFALPIAIFTPSLPTFIDMLIKGFKWSTLTGLDIN